jgi:hypothetical protein
LGDGIEKKGTRWPKVLACFARGFVDRSRVCHQCEGVVEIFYADSLARSTRELKNAVEGKNMDVTINLAAGVSKQYAERILNGDACDVFAPSSPAVVDENLMIRTVAGSDRDAASLDRLFPKFFISKRKEREIAMQYVDKLRIATPSTSRLAQYLSGGNQQKVVHAKWLCGLMTPNISGRSKNAILPGWIDTDLTATARTQIEGLNERVMARTPAKRWGSPDDFAGITIVLASAASDFVTGTAIPIDGGYSIRVTVINDVRRSLDLIATWQRAMHIKSKIERGENRETECTEAAVHQLHSLDRRCWIGGDTRGSRRRQPDYERRSCSGRGS